MFQYFIREKSFFWKAIEHWYHKIFKILSFIFCKFIPKLYQNYFAIITSFKVQFCNLGILFIFPSFEKYFLALLPLNVKVRGNRPSNSII